MAVDIETMNIPQIIDNIKENYLNDNPYTICGKICISMNPFRWLDIYDINQDNKLFQIVDEILFDVHMNDQTIIISGESGSGKTECVKICLKYIMDINYLDDKNLMSKMLSSGPVLEYLGNAGTSRNQNSSRYGKFIKISGVHHVSASIQTFLLEKSRVVSSKHDNEYNYHVFESVCKKNGLKNENYSIMNSTNINKFDTDEIQNILVDIGLQQDIIDLIPETILLILNLNECIQSLHIDKLKDCLKLDDVSIFTHDSRKILNDVVNIELVHDQQISMVKSLMMEIYAHLFDKIVYELNILLRNESQDDSKVMGFLDIFGFEDFTRNCFEQFCINFANEKLHEQFLNCAIHDKIQEYRIQGIDLDIGVSQKNNENLQTCINIIDFLEEAYKLKSNEEQFMQNLHSCPKINFPKLRKHNEKHVFCINHFADQIRYNANLFLDKNKDLVKDDVLNVIKYSKSKVLNVLFGYVTSSKKSSLFSKTVASKFKIELFTLCEYISSTHTYFIRCILPNKKMQCESFEDDVVYNQIKYCGLIDACEVVSKILPKHVLVEKFSICLKYLSDRSFKKGHTKIFCDHSVYVDFILTRIALKFQAYYHMKMTIKRNFIRMNAVHVIQSTVRMKVVWKEFNDIRKKCVTLQSYGKKFKYMNERKKKLQQIVLIQTLTRRYLETIKRSKVTHPQIQDNISYQQIDENMVPINREDLNNLRNEVKILTEELEKQEIWLMRAKRLILLYACHIENDGLKTRANNLLDELL